MCMQRSTHTRNTYTYVYATYTYVYVHVCVYTYVYATYVYDTKVCHVTRDGAKTVRPTAKSFIRSISRIDYYRQIFSISMTSEVGKYPKTVESGRISRFSHLAIAMKKLCRSDV